MKNTISTLLLCLAIQLSYAQTEFITTWKTDNIGISEDNQITIPTFPGEVYNYTVVWGDGTTDTGITSNITHTYAIPGTYIVKVSGLFPRIYFNDTAFQQVAGDEEKLVSIEQWGTNPWTSMESAFAGCKNLVVEANDMPDLSGLQSLRRMFFWTGYPLNIPNIENWDVSTVTDLSGMFDKTSFIQDVSNWEVSNVKDMSYLFFSCPFNQDISNWDVSNVTNMAGMFGSGSFRQDVTQWDVGNVTNMDFMFNSTFFDQDISSWNVSRVTSMRHMLSQCSFNQDISSWNVGQVADMTSIFDDNDLSRENYDKILMAWSQLPSLRFGVQFGAKDVQYCLGEDARKVLVSTYRWNINDDGKNCEEERPFTTTWKTDNPGFSLENQITIPTNPREVYNYSVDWGDGTSDTGITSDITHTYLEPGIYQVSISGRFPSIYFNSGEDSYQYPSKNADAKKILSVDQWGTNRWISLSFAFAGCSNLDVKATDVPDLSKDIFLSSVFLDCPSLIGNESFALWDLSYISFSASGMFSGASQFNQPINQWDVSKIRYLDRMFEGATSFNQGLENWNVGKAENLDDIFDDSGLSTRNYDKILTAWSNLPILLNGVKLGANNIQYCDGEASRQNLIDSFGWVITDAGKDCSKTYFKTTWKTDNPGASEDNQIAIPTVPGEIYNYTIDWGDGNSDTAVTGNILHTYDSPGIYQVRISGDFPRIYFNNYVFGPIPEPGDENKLLSIDQWGSIEWTSMDAAFAGCANLDVLALDIPDLSKTKSMVGMFRFCSSLIANETIGDWNVSSIESLAGVFYGASMFNQDLGGWDVSTVTRLSSMFFGASTFNRDISNWDISNVEFFDSMFSGAEAFNQPIGSWDVQNLTSMHALFAGASSFNQDISNWNVINVQNMGAMFSGATSFNQDISNWDVGNVTSMNSMFPGAESFNSPLNSWDVSSVTDMRAMFDGAISFNQPLNDWDISNVTEISSMFVNAISFNQPLNQWDVSKVTSMNGMFGKASSFNQDISDWNMGNVTSIGGMFNQAISYDRNLGKWDVSMVTSMDYLFNGTGLSLENYDKTLIGWNALPSLQNDVVLKAGSSRYCEATEARQNMIDTYGWIISDAGKVPLCNEDNDEDGVLDHRDACLNTQPGLMVNANGCDFIPNDAIKVYVLTPSCVGNSDGSIEITMGASGYLFDILIEGEGVSRPFDDISSDSGFGIDDLPVGSYTVSVSIPEILFEQKYGVTVNALNSVSGKRASLDSKSGTVSYSVIGSTTYEVSVNGKKTNFTFDHSGQQTIALENLSGLNEVIISGDSDCQGKITDSFFMGSTIQVFPTITSANVNVLTNGDGLKVWIYNLEGRLVKELNCDQQENNIDISMLESGIYFLRISMGAQEETVKIVKQ